MKEKIREELEKIVEVGKSIGKFVKDNGKKLVISVALPLIFVNNVDAARLDVYNGSTSVSYSYMNIKHISGATEGQDWSYDGIYLESPNLLQIYSHNDYSGFDYFVDARPADSTTTYDLHLKNTGFFGTADNMLRFVMKNDDNFKWKNIFLGDANDSDNIVADIKYVIDNGSTTPVGGYPYGDFPLPDIEGSNIGVYDKRKVFFFNHADFNRDTRTNGLDFKIFRENFGRNNETDPNTFGSYVGSEPNNYNAYADIDRNGTVGPEDLAIFKTYFKFLGDLNLDGRVDNTDFAYLANDWNIGDANFYDLGAFSGNYLRDINDPNTWSKLTPKVDGMSVLDNKHLRDFQREAFERFYGKNEVPYLKEEREAA